MSNALTPGGGENKPISIRELARKMATGGCHRIPGKDIPPTRLAPGVKTIKDKCEKTVFACVDHDEAAGILLTGNAAGEGMSGQLAAARPYLPYGVVWCGRCNKPCDFEEGGLHNLFGKRDSSGNYRGYILIQAECHGDYAEIAMTFEQARNNAGKQIIAFPFPKIIAAKVRSLPMRQLGLPSPGDSYWTARFAVFLYRRRNEPETPFQKRTREIIERFRRRQK